MHHFKLSTVFAFLVTGVLLGTAIDGMLNVGDTFIGNITLGGSDTVEFEGLAGELVTVSVKASKGQSLLPLVRLLAPDTSELASAFGKKKVSLKKIELPVTGLYRVEVSATNNTIGSYKMTTKSKLPKSITKTKTDTAVGNGETQDSMFDAKSAVPDRKDPKGPEKTFLLNGTIKSSKKSEAVPFNPTIVGPEGDEGDPVELTGFITKDKKGNFKIKNLALPDLGTYVLSVENSGVSGLITTSLQVKKPKLKKQVIEKDL